MAAYVVPGAAGARRRPGSGRLTGPPAARAPCPADLEAGGGEFADNQVPPPDEDGIVEPTGTTRPLSPATSRNSGP